MNKIKTVFFIIVACFAGNTVLADQAADEASIRQALGELKADSITSTPVSGVYEVVVGAHVVYVSGDGQYMFQGEMIDLKNRQSLTEPRRREVYKVALNKLGEEKMIVFTPEKAKHSVTVFTDVDCGYCRKLHAEMDQYMQAGIEIRYLFFPRAGIGSESYKKAVATWCSEDRQQALTDTKKGKPIPMKTCENPIGEHMEMAQLMGLRGTPFIILESGEVKPGYLPAKQLSLLLDQAAQR